MYRLTTEYFFLMMIGVEMCEFGWLFTSCPPLHETLGFLQNVCVILPLGGGLFSSVSFLSLLQELNL